MSDKHKGFTLLELLLVISVLAAMSLYVFQTERKDSRLSLAEQISVEMQNILVAQRNYIVNEPDHQWAPTVSELINKQYLPKKALCSPLPGSSSASECPEKIVYKIKSTDRYVEVSIATGAQDLATRIANTLPLSSISGGTVTASTPIPSNLVNAYALGHQALTGKQITGRGWIHAGGVVKADSVDGQGQQIPMPTCPNGFEGHYMLFWQRVTSGHVIGLSWSSEKGELAYMNYWLRSNIDFSNYTNQGYVKLNLDYANKQSSKIYYGTLYYLSFCLPAGNWFPGGATMIGNSPAKQCGASNWNNYNTYHNSVPLSSCNQRSCGPILTDSANTQNCINNLAS